MYFIIGAKSGMIASRSKTIPLTWICIKESLTSCGWSLTGTSALKVTVTSLLPPGRRCPTEGENVRFGEEAGQRNRNTLAALKFRRTKAMLRERSKWCSD